MTILKNKRKLLGRRRELRKEQTEQEKILWENIRNRKLNVKFRRQYSVGGYILDFYSPEAKLAVEIDGGQHFKEENYLYDQDRTEYIKVLDCKVLRFKNTEIDQNLEGVLAEIKRFLPSTL